MTNANKPLALTLGDPAGIGPDISLFAFAARRHEHIPPFVLLGDPEVLRERARALDLATPIEVIDDAAAAPALFAEALPVLPVSVGAPVVAGCPDQAAAPAIRHSIERAVALVIDGAARAVVTNPISKAVLYRSGFAFPGHTEFLADIAGLKPSDAVMMLAADTLRVVPTTIHIPLRDVPAALSEALILKTLATTSRDLSRYFGLAAPRIAVTGLNPHAGEDGTLGREEVDIIIPAIEAARRERLNVAGPYPADALFHGEARKTYDVAVAMYHDQALVPFKTLAFDSGVNVTLGLPFVRTSPDHGTAFALAGTGSARPHSLIEALRLAEEMSARVESAP
jgi:4-hydroxythreonine-4-phosphate dehydrogenase